MVGDSNILKCPKCNKTINDSMKTCPICGISVEEAMKLIEEKRKAQEKNSPIIRYGGGCLLIFFGLGLIGVLFQKACGPAEAPKAITQNVSPAETVRETEEYMLAVNNAGHYVSKEDITVARFRSLLEQLSNTYVENKKQIADMSVAARNLIRKDGVEETILNIMEGMNQVFPRKIDNQKYSEYIAAYATLRVQGKSHDQAILGLRTMVLSIIK